jgi:soluble lytic murein transglycosylase-like protein
MAALKRLGIVLALLAATPAVAADPLDRWHADIAAAARRFDIPAGWIERVMRAESGGKTMVDGRPITSRAGAMGLMQLMPGTWADMRAALGLGVDPYDPHDNILAGAAYLKRLYDRYGYPGLFAAYNAGPARYEAWRAGARALPAETRAYLLTVGAGRAQAGMRAPGAPRPDPLFSVRVGARGADAETPRAVPNGLFAIAPAR